MRPRIRQRAITLGILVATLVVVLLLVLIGFGVLVLPSPPSKTMTVSAVDFTLQQGTTSQGVGWFGASEFSYTGAEGYPTEVAVGSTLVVQWQFSNFDTVGHTIEQVNVTGPFLLLHSDPSLPITVPPGTDDGRIGFTIQVPNDAGADLTIDLSVSTS